MRPCPVCGDRRGSWTVEEITLELPKEIEGLPDRFTIRECDCGTIFNDSDITEAQLAAYYAWERYTPTRPYRDERTRCEFVADRLTRFHKIGEIGEGDGLLGSILTERGHDYSVVQGDETYDVIVLNQVLEHLLNPLEVIEYIRARTNVIHVEVPDGYREVSPNFEHLNRFSWQSLHRLFGPPIEEGEWTWQVHAGAEVDILWGTYALRCYVRGYTHRTWRILPGLPIEVVGAIDQDPRCMTFRGQPVLSPDDELIPGIPILICSDWESVRQEMAKEYPRQAGAVRMTTAILIPAMRPQLLPALVQIIHAATPEDHEIHVMGTPDVLMPLLDDDSLMLHVDGGDTWGHRLNWMFGQTTTPYVFHGSEDALPHPGFLTPAMGYMDKVDGVVGTNDLFNPRGTLSLVSRAYIDELSGCVDVPGVLIHPEYHHNYSETELYETAQSRGRFAWAADSVVEHFHWRNKKMPYDEVYSLGDLYWTADEELFFSRRHLWAS